MNNLNTNGDLIGVRLAGRLGLELRKREGHDLAGPCIACQSSDAFRLHMQSAVAQCYSCGGRWSPLQLAEVVTGSRQRATDILSELGILGPRVNGAGHCAPANPLESIAQQKGVSPEALAVYGAKAITPEVIQLPCYGPDGKRCTTFSISIKGGKGLFAKGKPAGLFFSHVDSKVRLPKAGEVWHLVEGVKDAAALQGLGLLACGVNTCRLAAKFARLFAGTDVILIPDRDRAGEEGSEFTARVLHGHAQAVRIAVLPAEHKDSDGADVRDILRRTGGRDLVLQAIADAQPPEGWESKPEDAEDATPLVASIEIALPEGDPIRLEVAPTRGELQRLIVATRCEIEHRDRINTDSSISRDRFVKKLAAKLGIDPAVLAPLIDPQLTTLADEIDKGGGGSCRGADEEPSQATIAANMALEWDLWHTPAKDAFATIPIGNHNETWPVKSQIFKRYLSKQVFDATGKAMYSEALSAAVNLIEAKALFEGEEHSVYVRLAEQAGSIYLDLCNADWQVVEITADGWTIIDESPVRFRRSRSMLPLPHPERGGSIDQLRPFLNVDDNTWCLVVSWVVANLRPRGPYPVLALFAEQGSGKSTTGRLLRDLVDPNESSLRGEPRDARDLMITANNSWCLAYDNLSHIPPWLSDALCRLSTGGGFATRELYTDQDEIIFNSQRPVLLTSIEEVASRSDLLDRCLIAWLQAIPEDQRRPEAKLFEEFEQARPFLLGALLDAVVVALRRLPTIQLAGLPRMADFALWASAAETAFGWELGTFLAAYQSNRESANDVALEASSVARPLLELLDEQGGWSGTATDLITELEGRVTDQTKRQNGWPKNGRSISGHLKRLAPNLRSAGWQVGYHRGGKQRRWTIEPAEFASSVTHSPPGPSSNDGPSSVQFNANPYSASSGDANDGRDAIADSAEPLLEQNEDGWEEGEL